MLHLVCIFIRIKSAAAAVLLLFVIACRMTKFDAG